jgi:hypothetical protein
LLPHKIPPHKHLGDRVFHLDAGVDLDEVKIFAVHEELHGSGAHVAYPFRQAHRRAGHPFPKPWRQCWCRSFLHELLVPPLHRAVPRSPVHDVSEFISEDLDLHMPRLGNVVL